MKSKEQKYEEAVAWNLGQAELSIAHRAKIAKVSGVKRSPLKFAGLKLKEAKTYFGIRKDDGRFNDRLAKLCA